VDDDARIRRALQRLAGPEPRDDVLERVRHKKRRYRLARRLQAAGLTVAVVAATGAGVYGLTTLFDSDDVRPAGSGPSTTEGRTACPGDIPFQPSYLPQGFGREPVEGPAPGAPPAHAGQTVIHFRDDQGRAIEIRRPATPLLEPGPGDGTPSVPVLGREPAEPGPADGEGLAVHFRDPNGEAGDPCATYSVEEYGVGREELIAVADLLQEEVEGGTFAGCPEPAGTLPPGPGASEDASAAAVTFVRSVREGDAAVVRELTDPGGWPLVPLGTRLAGEPVTVLAAERASGDDRVAAACGELVGDRSWRVTIDDGTESASMDLELYLIRRSDGWKVWGLY
jgi:hypothetical protein